MMEPNNTFDMIRGFKHTAKAVLIDAAETNRGDRTLGQTVSATLKNWAETAEQDKKAFYQRQQALQQQQYYNEANFSLKHMLSYALNCLPSHLDFWGNLCSHSIHLCFCEGIWTFTLIHSSDAHQMPQHFHQTASELQNVLTDIYTSSIKDLAEKIRTDAETYFTQSWSQSINNTKYKNDFDFWNDYSTFYKAYRDYLWDIAGITMTPKSNGVKVSFSATFNDCGLSPACYWQNMRSVLRI